VASRVVLSSMELVSLVQFHMPRQMFSRTPSRKPERSCSVRTCAKARPPASTALANQELKCSHLYAATRQGPTLADTSGGGGGAP
jgi:hypothetical protein